MSGDEPLSLDNKATNAETWAHIDMVIRSLHMMQTKLGERMLTHDRSKLRAPEVQYFTEHTPKLNSLTFGSAEYAESLKAMQPALIHHYANNRHHPEFHKNGINDMTLVDLMEMLCDWYASSKRQADGNIRKSIEKNRERFGMSDQLIRIFENTAKEFGE
jgi:hypothetical protein